MKKEDKGLTPTELTGLRVGSPKSKSVGLDAISSSIKQMRLYMHPAEAVKLSLKMNQQGGFDCPGCAWPDPDDDRSRLGEYCENGFKALAEEATKKALRADYFAAHSVEDLRLKSDFVLGKLGRLTEPMVLNEDRTHYTPISWEAAYRLIASELQSLASPDEAVFYTSGRTSNEAAFMYQLFVRAFGTNNLPDCSNMCHESSGVGLSETVGIGKGSVTLEDLYEAEVIMVMGQNPGTNHPRMLSALEKCKKNGGRIISVNPLNEAGLRNFVDPQSPMKILKGGTNLTDLYLPVRINGDVGFLKAVMKLLLEKERLSPGTVFDRDFIEEQTSGYQQLIQHLDESDLQECIQSSGLTRDLIEQAAAMLANKKKVIICWAMGLTQHENGVENIREIVNLLLLKGAIGIPGAGTCPVRGHSNVQGDRTMGIWELPPDSFLDRLDEVFQITSPRQHGYATIQAIEAMHRGEVGVFFAMGGNFLSATPDTEYTAAALKRCQLTVHVSTKLNRSHLIHGKQALILPCLGRTNIDVQATGEQFVSCENSMGVVQSSQGILPPPSTLPKSEVAIVCELAEAVLGSIGTIRWLDFRDDYHTIRDAIELVIPGFEQYNERVRQPNGFYLPNGARERKFNTDNGKAKFTLNHLPDDNLGSGEYRMMTIRSHDQFNTTIYGLDDRYRGIYNERRVLLMSEDDINRDGLSAGQLVNLTSEFKGKTRLAEKFIVVSYAIPPGNVATYFPEANSLVPIDSYARKSLTPCSKLVKIRIEPIEN